MDAPTTYDAYLEIEQSGRCIARIPDLTGCLASGSSEAAALAALSAAIPAYFVWLKRHDDYTPDVPGPWQITPRDTFRTSLNGDYEVHVFLPWDDQPVNEDDLDWGLSLLQWAMEDLAALVRDQPAGTLDRRPAAGGWSIRELLTHQARSQLWFVTRLDDPAIPPPMELGPGDPAAQLLQVARASAARLRAASSEQRVTFHDLQGERWSVRKILRRGVEHAREHTEQIRAILG